MACKTLKIGVFFDGTDNSKKKEEEYSNVAKLHESYDVGEKKDEKENITTIESIYIVGLGHGESEGKMSLAAGKYGAKKVYDAISQVEAFLETYPSIKVDEKNGYKSRTIDVFGFSRGAAEARDFVNTFIKDTINKKPKHKDVRFNFIGLFDTVGSFGIAGNDIDMKPRKEYLDDVDEADMEGFKFIGDHENNDKFESYNFNLHANSARIIVQLRAADEVRYNFPLTNIFGAGQDIECIGVHSDIGGGYGLEDKETLIIGEVHTLSKQKKKELERKGWKYHKEIRSSRSVNIIREERYTKKRIVPNNLSLIYLHLMYDKALIASVPFDDFLKAEYPIVGILKHYSCHVLDGKTPKSYPHDYVKERYAHQSATHKIGNYISYPLRNTEGFSESFVGVRSNDVSIVNNQVRRNVYNNQIDEAILVK